MITPAQIANGRDDQYPLRLERVDRELQSRTVYIRPFAEMNLAFNPYSAFNADGSRAPGHSTKGTSSRGSGLVLIVRGGRRDAINNKLMSARDAAHRPGEVEQRPASTTNSA